MIMAIESMAEAVVLTEIMVLKEDASLSLFLTLYLVGKHMNYMTHISCITPVTPASNQTLVARSFIRCSRLQTVFAEILLCPGLYSFR